VDDVDRQGGGFHLGGSRELSKAEPVATAQRGGWACGFGQGSSVPAGLVIRKNGSRAIPAWLTFDVGQKMTRKVRVTLIGISALYAATWALGTASYQREMLRLADAEWSIARKAEERHKARDGLLISRAAFPEGPRTKLHWTLPLVPAVLLVNSDYTIGPRWGHGGFRLVIVFGPWTVERTLLLLWIS
jgi:hypothetical protein